MNYILVCSCSGGKEKAEVAFSILKPDEPTPQIVKGKEAIAKLAAQYDNSHLRAISKLSGNFSYYVEITESGKITSEYDLITGSKVI